MESLEHLQEIVRMSAMEIDALLREHPDLTTDIEYLELPEGEFFIVGLAMIEVHQQGIKDPIFTFDISLDKNDAGELHLFCHDVTMRDEPHIQEMEKACRRLKQLLTVFKLQDITAEKIIVDFFRKMAKSENDKKLEFFAEN